METSLKSMEGFSPSKEAILHYLEKRKDTSYSKVDIALARGKHYYDKRESLKTKDSKRDIEKQLKGF